MIASASPAPANLLMEFVLGILTPLLMAGSITDPHLARLVAAETIAAYKARGENELVTIAQILGFALTALDNLRLSMPAELPLSMKLKLRGSASALGRCAQDGTRMLEKFREANPPLQPSLAEQAATVALNETEPCAVTAPIPAAARESTNAPTTEQQNRLHWARAMQNEAARLKANAASVSPAQQKTDRLWVDVLSEVANELTQGKHPVSGAPMSRAELPRTTLMAGNPGFPAHLSSGVTRSGSVGPKRGG